MGVVECWGEKIWLFLGTISFGGPRSRFCRCLASDCVERHNCFAVVAQGLIGVVTSNFAYGLCW